MSTQSNQWSIKFGCELSFSEKVICSFLVILQCSMTRRYFVEYTQLDLCTSSEMRESMFHSVVSVMWTKLIACYLFAAKHLD